MKSILFQRRLLRNILNYRYTSDKKQWPSNEKLYEENPFPRWRFTLRPIKGNDINEFTNRYSDTFFKKPEILIAGCGTGQQAMAWSAYKDSKIYAVDLSSESLAYAIRKAKEKNIKNNSEYSQKP